MLQVKEALLVTTSHGLPRLVLGTKPLYVRIIWFMLFVASLCLCLKGLVDFARKLESRQVSTTLDSNGLAFRFPDVYACFENPISSSFAASLDNDTVSQLDRGLGLAASILQRYLAANNATSSTSSDPTQLAMEYSFALLHSLQYSLLVDTMAHRIEQALITSDITHLSSTGLPSYSPMPAISFYHPVYLHCIRWRLNDTVKATLAKSGTSGGLVVTLLTDANFSAASPKGPAALSGIFAGGEQIPVSDWSLSRLDFDDPDRRAGVRVYLCPPGDYPTAFVKSFSLGPGRYHTVEIGMTEQVYSSSSFDCISDPPQVQFVNPYTQEPYNHTYSYSYCYFYEYHRQYQAITNLSGDASPLPWPLRGRRYLFNLTGGEDNFLRLTGDLPVDATAQLEALSRIVGNAQQACKTKIACSSLSYDVTISSTDWPTYSSVVPFVGATVYQAKSAAGNSSVPALDRLLASDAATAAAYIKANLLKVNFKIRVGANSNRVTFSIDYGLANFIADMGGTMGIYLGMSLLTLCEFLELAYDLAMVAWRRRATVAAEEAVQLDKARDDGTQQATSFDI